ncbi:MBL fold metallo-hydrolase [Streptomyces varsoviensis]|uniref:Hydrolase n=1 Tax=Streptomyces varsoviensis TaxID=67373 RepID=A0ABR5J2L6_9ACTN|nr:MBL fold metallo-hydrolase [Streptomyces varsoviensis]KOG87655.1 hydrolase [Streptomyces varsoviensis]
MAHVTDHGGGVWSIPVPIPDNPLGHTLIYLLATDDGPVLIDTGWDDPGSWEVLAAGLAECGTSVAELRGVLITHHHPDHHGLSGQVREASGAWIAMHPADADVVRRTRETEPLRWLGYLVDKLAAAGAPDDHLAPLTAALAEGRARPLPGHRAALPDRAIEPGELLDLPGRRLRAVWTPGHTPGHVCLHLEEDHPDGRPGHGRLFSGDHLLPGITPHIGLYEDPEAAAGALTGALADTAIDPLGDYLASLERVAALSPAEVLPAHQHPFTDAPARVRELLTHHQARLADLRQLLTTPRTPWQLAVAMEWNRPWADIPYTSRNIAVSEAEAHLRRLVKLGHAEPVPGSEPVAYRAV